MTPKEAAALLAYAATFDNRKPDAAAAQSWAEALGNLDLSDCKQAVLEHVRASTEYLTVAHIVERVRAMRVERMKAVWKLTPPAELAELDGDAHTRAYLAWLNDACARLANSGEVPDAPHEVLAPPERVRAAIEATAAKFTHKEPA